MRQPTDEQTERRFAMMGRAALLPGMLHLRDLLLPILEKETAAIRETLLVYQAEQLATAETNGLAFLADRPRRGRPTSQMLRLKAAAKEAVGAVATTKNPGGAKRVKEIWKNGNDFGWSKDPMERRVELMRRNNVTAEKRGEPLPNPKVGTKPGTAKIAAAVAALKGPASGPRKKRDARGTSPNHPRNLKHPGHAAWIALTTKNRAAALARKRAAAGAAGE